MVLQAGSRGVPGIPLSLADLALAGLVTPFISSVTWEFDRRKNALSPCEADLLTPPGLAANDTGGVSREDLLDVFGGEEGGVASVLTIPGVPGSFG